MASSLREVDDMDIANGIAAEINGCAESLKALFSEKAKLTLDTTKKEGRDQIFTEIKKYAEKSKPFEILKFTGVEIDQNSKIYSGFAKDSKYSYLITACLEVNGESVEITNFMLVKSN